MFVGTSAYPTYIIVPSGELPYFCDLCSKMFSDMLFEGMFPFPLDVCKEASGLQCELKRNLELHSD
jgi:hypothetical protein